MNLSEYKEEQVFLKELYEHNDTESMRVKNTGEYIKTSEAIQFIAFRKCINTPCPCVYTDSTMKVELNIIDIKPKMMS